MAHFYQICHKNCALKYVGCILEPRKLHFRGLKGQFNVKNAIFRGLIAKIDHYRRILASRTPLWPIFLEYTMEILPQGMLEGFLRSKIDFRGFIGQFDVKKANFRGLIAQIDHCRPILASRTHL